jgi:hypothetical protein
MSDKAFLGVGIAAIILVVQVFLLNLEYNTATPTAAANITHIVSSNRVTGVYYIIEKTNAPNKSVYVINIINRSDDTTSADDLTMLETTKGKYKRIVHENGNGMKTIEYLLIKK